MNYMDLRIGLINKTFETLKKARKLRVTVDDEKLVNELAYGHGVSRRTALEYIRAARARLESEPEQEELTLNDVDKLLTRSE